MHRDDHEAALQRVKALTDELGRVVSERDALAAENAEIKGGASAVPFSQRQRLSKALAKISLEREQLVKQVAELTSRLGKHAWLEDRMDPDTQQRCPKCAGLMQRGYLVDQNDYKQFLQHWAFGQPERFSGYSDATLTKEVQLAVGTFRCVGCGFLESYARDEFSPRLVT